MPDIGLPDCDELYDEAACGLLVTDREGTILRANATFCRWVDVEAGELVGKRRFQDLLTMGGRIFHQTHWAPLLRMQGSISEVKLDLLHAAGHAIPVVMNALSREHQGRVLHELSVFIARDRHQYERELMHARKQAEDLLAGQQDRALFAEQMMGIVGHDLRSPLSAITLGTELLGRSGLSDGQKTVVDSLARSVRRARRLTDDLLDFTQARIGRGLAIDPRRFDVQDAVAHQAAELRLAYPRSTLVHRHVGDRSGRADPDRVFQVLANLVANATAYGAPDEPITITSRVGGGSVTLAVHNHGPAIPAATLPILFKPMVRGGETAADTRSVGLGLYIVCEIARAHGGDVSVSSTEEDGTEFTVTLSQSTETPQ